MHTIFNNHNRSIKSRWIGWKSLIHPVSPLQKLRLSGKLKEIQERNLIKASVGNSFRRNLSTPPHGTTFWVNLKGLAERLGKHSCPWNAKSSNQSESFAVTGGNGSPSTLALAAGRPPLLPADFLFTPMGKPQGWGLYKAQKA